MKEKFRKYFKKVALSLTTLVMMLSTVTMNASALTGVTSVKVYDDWLLSEPTNNYSNGDVEGYIYVNNEPVYCVDYYGVFHKGVTVTAGNYTDIGISEATAKRLSLIAYYGNKVPGRTSKEWYAITQGLIWRTIHNDNSLRYVKTSITPDFASTQAAWNQILADVNRYYVAPSFSNATHEVDSDGSIRLNDSNGLLSDMVVANGGGLNVSISGNTLVVNGNPSANTDTTIVLRKNIAASETGTSIIYTSPNCQSLGSFKVSDPMQVALRVKVNKFGKLELTKYNDDKSASIEQTSYHITGPKGYDQIHTTDSTGKIKLDRLPVGDYKAVETQAGTGYLINTTEFGFTIKSEETTVIDPTNIEPTGKIELTKSIDSSQTNNLIGDATLNDNVYELHAKEKITNKANTKTFYQKDELVSSKKTDSEGKITYDDLPLGSYYIVEKTSNDSLVLNEAIIDVNIEYQGQTVSKVIKTKDTSNRVNMQKIQVFKSGEKDGISGLVKGLQGAEFTFKLKSEVDHVGWDNATTYAKVTTDKDGIANTSFLPYGQYLVKETVTPKDYITAPDFTISVTDDYTEYKDVEQVKRVNINNRPFTSQLKIVKVDKESGKTVTLNSASFKIKDSNGDYIVQKVAGNKYDTFTTNSKNQVIPYSDKGTVMLPLELDAGVYTIDEVKVPDGFLSLDEPVKFTITNQYNYDLDEDEDPILTVKVENAQPKGKIVLTKTDKVTSDPLENVEYELTAKEDIMSSIDGSVLFEKGSIVSKGSTNADGQIIIKDLFMGHYELRETLTNEGYVLSNEVHDIVFEQKDLATKEYVIDVNVTNIAPTGEIHLVKSDKDTKELLSGVTFELTAKEDVYSLDGRNTLIYEAGQTVSVDISENGLYMTNELGEINIGNLPLGHYELKEVNTLDGYYSNDKVYDIDLRYDYSDKVIYTKDLDVENTQTITEITKVDATDSKEIPGATLSLYDKDDNLVEQWTSTEEAHIIRGLLVNEEYRLHEDLAPVGYATTSDITFTISDDGTPTKVVMKDEVTKVDISKVDATTSKEIEGAKLTLTDKETGKVVETWTSTAEAHRITGLEVNKTYILHEDLAPKGYKVASDVEFTIADTGEVQKVVMKDELLPTPPVSTGDNTNILFYVGLLAFAGGMSIFLYNKKRIESDQDE